MKDRGDFDALYRQTSAKLPRLPARLRQSRRGQGGAGVSETGRQPGIWSSLAFWRGLAAAALAALFLYIALPGLRPAAGIQASRLVASLSAEGSDVRYLVVYDEARGEVSLSHVSGQPVQDRAFEL